MSATSAEPIPFPTPQELPHRPRLKKLRLLLVLVPLLVLAVVSFAFGMMMAVASDVGSLENAHAFQVARNSVITDVHGKPLGILTNAENRIIIPIAKVAKPMRNAIVAIEDRRFWQNQDGVDIKGVARAFVADLFSGHAAQGGSTITMQFVKNALSAQNNRTVFEKLREAALAYHLAHRWPKSKILQEYLNTIYFGNGAYGIESAARTFFGHEPWHAGCGDDLKTRLCASELQPWEAALLAGMVASPSAYDPLRHPRLAKLRRNLVLRKMMEQRYITRAQFATYVNEPLPTRIEPPVEHAPTPASAYFITWVRQQVVDRFGPQRAYDGGLRVKTTLDLDLQRAAENAISAHMWSGGPSAALVAIDNATGQVRAMVGGTDYNEHPFNLATQGQRQPGSSIKPFILARALMDGISPNSVWTSAPRHFYVRGKGDFVVHNFGNEYAGASDLWTALTHSDNSVFAALGIHVGVARVARLAQRMGIRTPISHNLAMTLGGLRQGVTPLDMAHAYETIAHDGLRMTGTLGSNDAGPVGIREVDGPSGNPIAVDHTRAIRVLPASVAHTEAEMMTGPVTSGTGTHAAVTGLVISGKTGTTENYGDAWFVGFSRKYTVAIWVGYADHVKSMSTDYHGGPVEGGTFPADIFHTFMESALAIDAQHAAERALRQGKPIPASTQPSYSSGYSAPSTTYSPSTSGYSGASSSSGYSSSGTTGTSGTSSSGRYGYGGSSTGTGTSGTTGTTGTGSSGRYGYGGSGTSGTSGSGGTGSTGHYGYGGGSGTGAGSGGSTGTGHGKG